MRKFSDLVFAQSEWSSNNQAKMFFDNGYMASVIIGPHSYGGREGLYEVGVGKGKEGDWDLCYTTPITNDVLGYLSVDDVTRLLNEIEALPKAED